MSTIALVTFLACTTAVFYTYVGYPWLLACWARRRGVARPRPVVVGGLPAVSILIAAYNEAAVIGGKLHSLLASEPMPRDFEVLVGDDVSDDGTGAIVERIAAARPNVRLVRMPRRTGKPGVMNELVRRARGEVLVFTDADVLFCRDAIGKIAAWFSLPDVRLVAANVAGGGGDSGVMVQERAYLAREIQIKRRQSEVSGVVIAPFGACFAIRRADYVAVPDGFAVDDFFISMYAQLRGGHAVQAIDALCHEDVASSASEQFRRKVRIARGNFQNLLHFLPVALRVWRPLGFHFVSHKVLRWLGPIWLAGSGAAAGWLAGGNWVFRIVAVSMLCALTCVLVDRVAGSVGTRVPAIRFVAHFLHMNLALGAGMLAWAAGQRGSVWNPTRRSGRAPRPTRRVPPARTPADPVGHS